ncbi:MAG: GNAT family N-acetyltransferase, partial [Acidobacteria bacterium]|nr:GNAT family N-acetyltransferase [Acidobacteriota bacterium]
MPARSPKLEFHPLTPDRWQDFETLFGERGACGGCWCMAWRLPSKLFDQQKGAPNKKAMKAIVARGTQPGVLAYVGDQAVGWCSIAPREVFVRLETSRVLKPIDDKPVWSISCFFIAKEDRRQGLSVKLLKAAVDFVRQQGGKIVEGYPNEPKKDQPDVFMWT